GSSMKTSNGRKFIYPEPNKSVERVGNFYNGVFTTSTSHNYRWFSSGADMTNVAVLNLDSRYGYQGGNLNSFMLEITYLESTANVQVKDFNGTVIADKTTLSKGIYMFEW